MAHSFFLPWPPSTNTYYRNMRGRMVLSAKGRAYKIAVADAILQMHPRPRFGDQRVAVNIELCPPDRRKFDIDNRIKAVFDALTAAGVWEDDSQVDELHVSRATAQGKSNAGVAVRIVSIHMHSSTN